MEEILDYYNLLVNNKVRHYPQLMSEGILVINQIQFTAELGFLTLWEILEEYPTLLDPQLILLRRKDINISLFLFNIGRTTRLNIQGLIKDENQFGEAKKT